MFIKTIKKSTLTLLFISVLATSLPLNAAYDKEELKIKAHEFGWFALRYIGIGALLSSGFFLTLKMFLPGFITSLINDTNKDFIKAYNPNSKATNLKELKKEIIEEIINDLDTDKLYEEKFKKLIDKCVKDAIESALSDEIQDKVTTKIETVWTDKLKKSFETILQDSTEITFKKLKEIYNPDSTAKDLKIFLEEFVENTLKSTLETGFNELKKTYNSDLEAKNLNELLEKIFDDTLNKKVKIKLNGLLDETIKPELTKTFDHLKNELNEIIVLVFGENNDKKPILDHATDSLNNNLDKLTTKLIGEENSDQPIIDQFTKSGTKQLELIKIVGTNLLFTLDEKDQKLPVTDILSKLLNEKTDNIVLKFMGKNNDEKKPILEFTLDKLIGENEEGTRKDFASRTTNSLKIKLTDLKNHGTKLLISDENKHKDTPLLDILVDLKDKEINKTLRQLKLNLLGAKEDDERSISDIFDARIISLIESQLNNIRFEILGIKTKKKKEDKKSLFDECDEELTKVLKKVVDTTIETGINKLEEKSYTVKGLNNCVIQ